MIISLDTHSGVPIFRQIIDQVERLILTGRLADGEKLPAVRDLAEELKVNPMTVSKAYSLLEAGGQVERRRGVGLFVRGVRSAAASRRRVEVLVAELERVATLAAQLGVDPDEVLELWREAAARARARGGAK